MPNVISITLAGQAYEIQRLTLGQQRALHIGMAKSIDVPEAAADRIDFAYDSDVAIVATALSRTHPDMTKDAIFDLETTKEEIGVAALAVLRFSGLAQPQGEAEAPVPATE
jgi:hypothetical protein